MEYPSDEQNSSSQGALILMTNGNWSSFGVPTILIGAVYLLARNILSQAVRVYFAGFQIRPSISRGQPISVTSFSGRPVILPTFASDLSTNITGCFVRNSSVSFKILGNTSASTGQDI
jgi:hypothetical protein